MRAAASLALSAVVVGASRSAFAQRAHGAPRADATPRSDPAPSLAAADPSLKPPARAKTEIASWEEALQLVRARSTNLKIVQQEVATAEANARIALAGLLPSVEGVGTYTHNLITRDNVQFARQPGGAFSTSAVQTPFPDYVTGGVTAKLNVVAPRVWYANGTASLGASVAQLDVADAKRTITLGVATAIVAVVAAERVAELNRVGLGNALSRLELAERKATLGGGTGLDIVRAKQDVEAARSTLVAGDESLRQTRESLGLAVGVGEQIGVPASIDLNGLVFGARKGCSPVSSIDERPDVAALRGQTELAHRAVNDVKLQFSPTIGLQSTLQTTTVDTGAAPNTTWNVQAILSVPIWDGGARYGLLRAAEATERVSAEVQEAARRGGAVEIARARRAVSVGEERQRLAGVARDLATTADRMTRAAYAEGRVTTLELVATAQALRESEIALALREYDVVSAKIAAVLTSATCTW